MPQNWDTPFTYGKMGNKEFPDAGGAESMPFHLYEKDMPSGSCPIDSPIGQIKVKQDVPSASYSSEDLSTKYNKSEWDSPYKDVHSIGSTHPQK